MGKEPPCPDTETRRQAVSLEIGFLDKNVTLTVVFLENGGQSSREKIIDRRRQRELGVAEAEPLFRWDRAVSFCL